MIDGPMPCQDMPRYVAGTVWWLVGMGILPHTSSYYRHIPLLASTTQRARCHNLRHPNQGKAETIAMSSNMHALIVAPRAIVNPMAPDHESRSQRKHVTCEHDDLYDDVVGACNTYGYPIAFGAPGYPWIEISHSLR